MKFEAAGIGKLSAGSVAAPACIPPRRQKGLPAPGKALLRDIPGSDNFFSKRSGLWRQNTFAAGKNIPEQDAICFAPAERRPRPGQKKTPVLRLAARVAFFLPSETLRFKPVAEAYSGSHSGGRAIVPAPAIATAGRMLNAALEATEVDYVIPLNKAAALLGRQVAGAHS